MVGDFLQKMQLAKAEFEQGKSVMEILFSDNPGIIRGRIEPIRDRIGDRVQLPERKKILPGREPVVEKISAIVPTLRKPGLKPVAIKKLPPTKTIRELYRYGR